MSKKTTNDISNKATEINPSLNSRGEEVPSSVSLVTVAHRRAVTLGERVARYTSLPTLQHDLQYDDEIEDGDDLAEEHFARDYDGPPMSKYEKRHSEILKNVKLRKQKEADEAKELQRKKIADEANAFRERVLQIKAEGAIHPPSKE